MNRRQREAAAQPASYLQRPERSVEKLTLLERWAHRGRGKIAVPAALQLGHHQRTARAIVARASSLERLSDTDLQNTANLLRTRFRQQGFTRDNIIEAFALVRESAGRALGMRHFEAQLIGGLMVLDGSVAEMATGEGKTLVATLPAVAAAFAGIPVHVVTVNDYLTERDAALMAPVYARLGLTTGYVVNAMPFAERRAAYAQAVTYCTNKELVFDYLKDQLVLKGRGDFMRLTAQQLGARGPAENLMLRGLHFAIVDEADSVLVDEARTPLIISGSKPGQAEFETVLQEAMAIAVQLEQGADYVVESEKRRVRIKDAGLLRIRELAADLSVFWRGRIRREEMLQQALYARHLLQRDQHYLVRDEKVQIIDELTGRIMADRSWERGLHQLVELKEGLPISEERETLARISYQRFFRKYYLLSGMTGTASEVRRELWSTYGLRVHRVPLNRPSRRQRYPSRIGRDEAEKWRLVSARIAALCAEERAVLVGTQSVDASEALSVMLTAEGIAHRVLNAKQDAEESAIVAEAGEARRVTVATSMAGRGTDITLQPSVRAHGGLHVILTEFHEAKRIDRQLIGRCARQGDPGTYEYIVSLDDFLIRADRGGWLIQLMRGRRSAVVGIERVAALLLMRRAQRRLERSYARVRRALFEQDQKEAELLAFAGRE